MTANDVARAVGALCGEYELEEADNNWQAALSVGTTRIAISFCEVNDEPKVEIELCRGHQVTLRYAERDDPKLAEKVRDLLRDPGDTA